jgi:mono/diheme cytochrome c family protein
MGKWIRRTVAGVAVLALLGAGAVFAGLQLADGKMNRQVPVSVLPVALKEDPQTLERGKYLFASRGCTDCHGDRGEGHLFVDEGGLRVKGPNLTTGPGGLSAGYSTEDWVRAIRHGVAPSGRPLMVMPSEDYNRFTDADLAALVAYIRSLPPVAGSGPEVTLPLPVRVLYGFGAIRDAASKIDHSLPPQQPVPEGVSLEHGAYVANMCVGCHGAQLAGGRIPGGPPDWPPASKLTPGQGSVMPNYADAQALLAMFRSGRRADGSQIKVMPFGSLRHVSEVDVRALHLYLTTLKPVGG